ncbi:DNA repair helicase (rad3) family protein, putative [Babesia bigemina]|uniref:DNA repair helicase (Rad3) family protein, putative n=1 Tax=Babesia bigemina TaxID=5866 RepID=A0A061D9I4_BABBI|nr:DNA repair helicase (rad3) family protein, putative [Babesia bigemina]CDR97326.1 DNA repair helicase (rad3) family protein, putative [Babesia bigemina]|eukprot:XP_012769512.1 DNA repair helicase (rad3) family protein, putative [Babesia bigemina]
MAPSGEYVHIIDGIDVRFPYQPYPCQTVYMETVIKAVKNGQNALLESPTGTGKTLALMCSSLACLWHSRFKDASAFKLNSLDGSCEASLLSTISDLRSSLQGGPKGPKGKASNSLRIIYASRTHSQLKQVIREAKKSSYTKEFAAKGLTTIVLGSRDQLCIHAGRRNATGEALNNFCRKLVQGQGCVYYNGLKKYKGNSKLQFYDFIDIEDLVMLGKSQKCCPFYASREAHETADVTLLPYNYLLSPRSREAMEIKLSNSVLIIDEAHNVESVAEAAATFAVRQVDIARYLMALRRFAAAHKKAIDAQDPAAQLEGPAIDFSAMAKLAVALKNFDAFLTNLKLGTYSKDSPTSQSMGLDLWQLATIKREHAVVKGVDVLQYLMKKIGLYELRNMKIDEVIKSCISVLSTNVDDISYAYQAYYDNAKTLQEDLQALTGLMLFFQHVYSKELLACPEYFHVFVTHDTSFGAHKQQEAASASPDKSGTAGGGWKSKGLQRGGDETPGSAPAEEGPLPKIMTFECLQATPSFLRLKNDGVRSILLTSGTLSPLSDLEKNIGDDKISFEYKLSNKHVAPASHVCARVITGTAGDPQILSSAFNTRSTPAYIKALGESLLTFAKCVPAGVLVFFGSYPVMESTVKAWKRTGIYSHLEKEKTIFVEARGASSAASAIVDNKFTHGGADPTQAQLKEYNDLVSKGRGCVFIGVCRGKIAEGIDFSDDACRGVFICGVPYPNPYEDNVALKMDYLSKGAERGKGEEVMSLWYNSQAIRAVNQAVGRSLRHIKDYGAVVLADRRYALSNLRKGISGWVTRNMEISDTMASCELDLRNFFGQFAREPSTPTPRGSSVHILPRFFTSITDSLSPSKRSEDADSDLLRFKSRRICSDDGTGIASSLRSGSQVTAFANGFMTNPTVIAKTQPPAPKDAAAPPSGWDLLNSWSNGDSITLTKFRKP